MLKETEVIRKFVKREMLCGSRVTCRPAPTDTDQDVIVLVGDLGSTFVEGVHTYYDEMRLALEIEGFVIGGSGQGDSEFESWNKGYINLILTADLGFYEKFVTATTVCQDLNIMEKHKRKMVFQAILYGNRPYEPLTSGLPGVPF